MKYIVILILVLSSLYAEEEYELGNGYKIENLPIYVGGYFAVDYRKKDEQDRYRIDDIAFLSYGGNNTLSYMLELESKELYKRVEDTGMTSTSEDHKLYVERLYVDYRISDYYSLRFGKFNSPIGFWNLIPVNVLRDTTSNPFTTQIIFPRFTTGVDASYSLFNESLLQANLMIQDNASIDHEYNNYNVRKHYAFGVSREGENYTFKLSGGYFTLREKQPAGDDHLYLLASIKYEHDRYQLLAEVGVQKFNSQKNYASYVQSSYRFDDKHTGVLRFESYKDAALKENDSMAIVGYIYRPIYPVSFKAEYQQHKRNIQNQMILSFSVLF